MGCSGGLLTGRPGARTTTHQSASSFECEGGPLCVEVLWDATIVVDGNREARRPLRGQRAYSVYSC